MKRRPECRPNAEVLQSPVAQPATELRILDDRTHLEDRQVHGDNQATDEYAENRHDHRLQQADRLSTALSTSSS